MIGFRKRLTRLCLRGLRKIMGACIGEPALGASYSSWREREREMCINTYNIYIYIYVCAYSALTCVHVHTASRYTVWKQSFLEEGPDLQWSSAWLSQAAESTPYGMVADLNEAPLVQSLYSFYYEACLGFSGRFLEFGHLDPCGSCLGLWPERSGVSRICKFSPSSFPCSFCFKPRKAS